MSQDEINVRFPNGFVGSPDLTEFTLLEPADGYPLKFLQSVQDPGVSYTCMDAAAVMPDYQVPLPEADAQLLGLASEEEAMVLVIVVANEDPKKATANLAGPLVLNTRTLTGVQVVLDTREYPLKYPIFAPKEDVILEFPNGLIGFEHLRSFRLFEPLGGYPLKFLQSVGEPITSFCCIDVAAIQPHYQVPFSEEDASVLSLEAPTDALVLALVVVPEDPRKMTANLAGPLVINGKTRIGRQIVLNTDKYPLKYAILPER